MREGGQYFQTKIGLSQFQHKLQISRQLAGDLEATQTKLWNLESDRLSSNQDPIE